MKRTALVFTGALAIVLGTATLDTALAAPAKSVSAAPLEVTYYYLPT